MGITGLIPFLEKASKKLQLKDIRGCSVAVDTYCWLHKGVFSCAEKLARGEDTDLYVQYCLKYVQMLLSYDIKPVLVFDGQHLPAKALTEKRRRENRQQSKKRAAELLRLGRVEEARSQMRRCVDVTHEMALRLIQACRERNVDCIVAPYEADAQMAWLNKAEIVQYIVTEDSDLTLFGAKKVIFKLDLTGNGLLVEADKLHLAMSCREDRYHFDKFRRMCILSGCDYLDSLPGIGLAKACKFILKTEQEDMRKALKKIPQYLNMRNLEVDDDYIENFLKAEATFKHMFIYNPLERRMERLNALEDFETDVSLCSNAGTLLADSQEAYHLALGNLNPFTLKRLDNWDPMKDQAKQPTAKHVKRAKHKSIWQSNFKHQDTKPAKQVQTSCALYFKKVDFNGPTIEAEMQANQRLEEAKQTEAEVFSIYSCNPKRRRRSSSSSSTEERREHTPPASPVQSKSRHNPFAKEMMVKQPGSPVCENSSLLRLLSPKKGSPISGERRSGGSDMPRVNAIKRSIFVREQVEIRSRFFSSKTDQPDNATEDTQRLDINSPNQKLLVQDEQEENSETSKQNKCDESSKKEDNKDQEETCCKKPKFEALDEVTDCPEPLEDIILLSDDDGSSRSERLTPPSSQETASSFSRQSSEKLKNFELPQTRRVGLSKPPAKTTSKSTTKAAKLASSTAIASQTKLSMFGFQKRPVLK
ncbi:uncharacterized protein Dwil_GK24343 [Drosophila willistoni]|uniref:Exonuclease 1 n=1 Tax=Drosophila willistoni TaxID=7260 RepID=B4MZN1_DROWI|nr:exonuclease 1 [Drosophila willistoni]EDW77816.1 uncharacterized protein Dwil_GK24343 [Drosophila willistoni]